MEIEQRDMSEEDESGGSMSNPSEDNYNEEKIVQEVYGLDNADKIINEKKKKAQEFVHMLEKEQTISGA